MAYITANGSINEPLLASCWGAVVRASGQGPPTAYTQASTHLDEQNGNSIADSSTCSVNAWISVSQLVHAMRDDPAR